MNDRTRSLLVMQGFGASDVDREPSLCRLARWTPLSCATLGALGLIASRLPFSSAVPASGWFFVCLGLLTLTGGITTRSIYDRLYNATIRHLVHTSPVPPHGAPRRFGCTIGGVSYLASGLGFLLGNAWLAYAPALFMVTFAAIAGLTHWCFASAIYAKIR